MVMENRRGLDPGDGALCLLSQEGRLNDMNFKVASSSGILSVSAGRQAPKGWPHQSLG